MITSTVHLTIDNVLPHQTKNMTELLLIMTCRILVKGRVPYDSFDTKKAT